MSKTAKSQRWNTIPTVLTPPQLDEFVLPYLRTPKTGPKPKISNGKVFNYILKLLHTGCQWAEIPIEKDSNGFPEVHHTRIYRKFRYWIDHGCIDAIFGNTVFQLNENGLLDTRILHGDGTSTMAKKGGDNLGFNGHKHMKGDKVVAICERNCNVICPFIAAPGNRNECPLLPKAIASLKKMAQAVGFNLSGTIMSFDGVYDSRANRKMIFNQGMTPNIPENVRNRKTTKRGRKRLYEPLIFKERFSTIERVFAWEDKFKRLLLRFERLSTVHYALKSIAYSMINLRNFC